MTIIVVEQRHLIPAKVMWRSILSYTDLKAVLGTQPGLDGLPDRDAIVGDHFVLPLKVMGIPLGQWSIEMITVDPDTRVVASREHGGPVKRWNHTLTITPDGDHACVYRDELDLDAGLLTPIFTGYAKNLYTARQEARGRLLMKRS
ncbi:MAG: hypothetical protein AAFR65_04895 [Pseudomonadota bacterium]